MQTRITREHHPRIAVPPGKPATSRSTLVKGCRATTASVPGGGSSTHVENITLSSVVPETWHAVEEAGDSEGLIEDNLEPDDADKVPCTFDEEAQRCVTPKSILLAQIIYLFSIWSSASSLFWESTNCRRRKEGRKEGRNNHHAWKKRVATRNHQYP